MVILYEKYSLHYSLHPQRAAWQVWAWRLPCSLPRSGLDAQCEVKGFYSAVANLAYNSGASANRASLAFGPPMLVTMTIAKSRFVSSQM